MSDGVRTCAEPGSALAITEVAPAIANEIIPRVQNLSMVSTLFSRHMISSKINGREALLFSTGSGRIEKSADLRLGSQSGQCAIKITCAGLEAPDL